MVSAPSAPRILQVVHGFLPDCRGGTESYVLEATLALRAAGHDVSVLAGSMEPRTPAQLARSMFEGIPVVRLHRDGLFLDNWEKTFDPAAALLFEDVLDAVRPDVVHVHHWIRLTRNLVDVAAARGIPAVVTLHDATASCPRVFRVRDESLCHRPLGVESCLTCVPRKASLPLGECAEEIDAYRADFARELDRASAIIVPSRAHQEFMSRELGRPASAFRIVPHGRLGRDRPTRPPPRARAGRIRLGHWGHLEPYKGYHLLLEALHLLEAGERERFEVVCFGVASDPGYRRRLDALSEGLVVQEHGAFAPRDLSSARFDLAVIPSIASESFSFVLDEAFELGVPALVSDRGALAERLGGAGLTFPAESAAGLAARLREVLANPAFLDRFAAAIPELGSMAEHADALARIYRGAVRYGVAAAPVDPAVATERLARVARRLEARTQALDQAEAQAAEKAAESRRKEADLSAFKESVAAFERAAREKEEALSAFKASSEQLRAEIARLEADVKAQVASRSAAEAEWTRGLAEYERSLKLHGERLVAHEQAAAEARRRQDALTERLGAAEGRVRDIAAEARALAAETAALHEAAIAARAAREEAERAAAQLDVARAEEQRQIASWRERALRAEGESAAVGATIASLTRTLELVQGDLADLRARADAREDDLQRVAALAARGAAALALPAPTRPGCVAQTGDLVAGVIAQQQQLRDIRAALAGLNGSTRASDVLRLLDAAPRRLRVLLVVHDFLPYHAAGSEVYTFQLATALQARCDVELLFCENRPERPEYEVRRGTYEGLPFTEIVHHAAFPDFRSTWKDASMEARFDEVLDRFRPDVVHFQHTKFFGVGVIARAARRGIPVVYTLHEYMLLCARDGQMVREDLARCELPDAATCATCLNGRIAAVGPVAGGVRAMGGALARVLPGAWKEAGTRLSRRVAVRHAKPAPLEARLHLVEARARETREALQDVDLFFAPSVFLRRTFVASGFVPAERIIVSRYGQDLARFSEAPPRRSGPLRVGYLGTIAAYKGVHVLVDALNRLEGYDVDGRLHGVTEFFPDYVAGLRARITNPRVKLLGRYDNQDVARVLAGMDVLVVPSLWWENSPITIHEAFLAGVPVVASDQGGMAELVEDGVNGFHFRMGDDADLARVLMRFVSDPGLVERLRPRRESIRDIREDALATEGHYRRLIGEKAAAP